MANQLFARASGHYSTGTLDVDTVQFLCHTLWTVYTMSHRKANPAWCRAVQSLWRMESDMLVQPYLMFNGRCEEAIDFYKKALGAEVQMLMRFKEAPEAPPPGMAPPNWDNKVMHACLQIGDTQMMASDGCDASGPAFKGINLTLTVANEAEAARKFAALSEKGQVTMPLGKTFFAKSFGMATDRFGVSWMVIVPAEMAAKAA